MTPFDLLLKGGSCSLERRQAGGLKRQQNNAFLSCGPCALVTTSRICLIVSSRRELGQLPAGHPDASRCAARGHVRTCPQRELEVPAILTGACCRAVVCPDSKAWGRTALSPSQSREGPHVDCQSRGRGVGGTQTGVELVLGRRAGRGQGAGRRPAQQGGRRAARARRRA